MKATDKIKPINDLPLSDMLSFFREQAIVIANSRPPEALKPISTKPKKRKTYTPKKPKLSNTDLDVL